MGTFGVLKRFTAALLFVSVIGAAGAPVTWPSSASATSGGSVVLYEPQVRSLANQTQLNGLVALAVTLPGTSAPVYGALTFSSLASADQRAGTMTLVNPSVTATNWPKAKPADVPALNAFVKANVNLQGRALPLSTVLSNLGVKPPAYHGAPLNTTPPIIFVSQRPALLVVFDGKPVLAPIAGTNLTYTVNANWPIIHDPATSRYYLLATSFWLSAPSAQGPLTPAIAPPSFASIPATPEWSDVRAHLNAKPPANAEERRAFVASQPAELITFTGPPQFGNIPGTQLRYVSNTKDDVFFSRDATVWYVLLAGRWFSAANLNGPWVFASTRLPADFRKIAPDSPRARVLVAVPGSAAALLAGSASQVPHVAPLDQNATLTVTYGPGAPQFAPIAGTPLQYAVNTPASVIKVSDSSYYACQGGVWFSAATPTGIWRVASYVPKVIYTIPPSSPLYPDTFVYVYDAAGVAQTTARPTPAPRPEQTYQTFSAQEMSAGDRANLYSGYMAGYAGGYYGQWGGYAYGTGYYSPGYYGSLGAYTFYGYPQTYGNYNDTTFARDRAEIGNGGPSAQFDPSTGTYARTGAPPSDQHYGPPGNATSIVTSADNNVYADPGGVFREQQGAWQVYNGAAGWTSAANVPPAVKHDAAARAKHQTAG